MLMIISSGPFSCSCVAFIHFCSELAFSAYLKVLGDVISSNNLVLYE